jgi:hypothetical protein
MAYTQQIIPVLERYMLKKNNAPTTLTGETKDGITWTYTGDVHNGLRHGKGKCTWANGDVYEGGWVDDKKHGKGKYTWADGKVYEGDWVDGKRHGKGKFTWADGDVYEGDWVDDKRTGKGKYTSASGSVYEGDFVDGKAHGKGKQTSANGDVYQGDFVDGEWTGKGEKTYMDGSVGEMGFIYFPNCGQSVSNQAKISACPKCYHPFDAKEWQRIQAQKDALAAEKKRKQDALAAEEKRIREEEEQLFKYAKDNDKCPLCHKPISWENKDLGKRGITDVTLYRPYCKSCGWKSSLAYESYCNLYFGNSSTSSTTTKWC